MGASNQGTDSQEAARVPLRRGLPPSGAERATRRAQVGEPVLPPIVITHSDGCIPELGILCVPVMAGSCGPGCMLFHLVAHVGGAPSCQNPIAN